MITLDHKGGGGESRRGPTLIMRYLNSPLVIFNMNVLSEYSLRKQNEDLLKILESAFPTNDVVQTSLQSLDHLGTEIADTLGRENTAKFK